MTEPANRVARAPRLNRANLFLNDIQEVIYEPGLVCGNCWKYSDLNTNLGR